MNAFINFMEAHYNLQIFYSFLAFVFFIYLFSIIGFVCEAYGEFKKCHIVLLCILFSLCLIFGTLATL